MVFENGLGACAGYSEWAGDESRLGDRQADDKGIRLVCRGSYFELLGAVVGSAGVVVTQGVVPEVEFGGYL